MFLGVSAVRVVGIGAVLLREAAVRDERRLEQALKDAERELEQIKRERDEKQQIEQDQRERRKREGIWLCDELPCNQGDLHPDWSATSGRRRR